MFHKFFSHPSFILLTIPCLSVLTPSQPLLTLKRKGEWGDGVGEKGWRTSQFERKKEEKAREREIDLVVMKTHPFPPPSKKGKEKAKRFKKKEMKRFTPE